MPVLKTMLPLLMFCLVFLISCTDKEKPPVQGVMPPAEVVRTVYVPEVINPDSLMCQKYPGAMPQRLPDGTWPQSAAAIRLPETESGWQSCYCVTNAFLAARNLTPADPSCRLP